MSPNKFITQNLEQKSQKANRGCIQMSRESIAMRWSGCWSNKEIIRPSTRNHFECMNHFLLSSAKREMSNLHSHRGPIVWHPEALTACFVSAG
jgi:hypothetical protein